MTGRHKKSAKTCRGDDLVFDGRRGGVHPDVAGLHKKSAKTLNAFLRRGGVLVVGQGNSDEVLADFFWRGGHVSTAASWLSAERKATRTWRIFFATSRRRLLRRSSQSLCRGGQVSPIDFFVDPLIRGGSLGVAAKSWAFVRVKSPPRRATSSTRRLCAGAAAAAAVDDLPRTRQPALYP